MKFNFPVHPLFVMIALSLVMTLSPACGGQGNTGATTPAAGQADTQPAADPSSEQSVDEYPSDEDYSEVADPPAEESEPAEEPSPALKAPPVASPPPAADPTPAKPAASPLSAEEKALLDYHNRVRADVKVPPLVWSDKLKVVAAAWGQKLVAKGCVMEHSQGSGYGENLYMGSAEYFTMVDAGKSWESEKQYYSGAPLSGSNWYKSGHYTQMVWRKTTELGCAKVTCKGSLIVICNYNPPGNFMGQKAY